MFKVLENGKMPTRGSKYSAAVDLYASEDVVIGACDTVMVGLGVCIDEQELLNNANVMNDDNLLKSHYLQLMLRSSLGKKGLIIPNGVGVIDFDYEDEIKVLIHNTVKHNKYFKKFKPNGDDEREYFYITKDGRIGENIWENGNTENELYEDGLIFKTYYIAKYVVDNFYFKIKKGDRIAQITLLEHKSYLFGIESDEDRTGGFGSSGTR